MQPTFMPWLGYFNLISSVDLFVILDSVQFESRSWQQRNKIVINGISKWITIPVTLPQGVATKINQVEINREHFTAEKFKSTIFHAYGKNRGYSYIESEIFPLITDEEKFLSDLNLSIIKKIAQDLKISTKFLKSSELQAEGSKADLILNICKEVKSKVYISPIGSQTYLDNFQGFEQNTIALEYQDYQHPVYSQGKRDFMSHLSIIDAIAHIGLDLVGNLVIPEKNK